MTMNRELTTPTWVTGSIPALDRLVKPLYTAPELMRLTGMTRKQVGYWAKIGLISPAFHDPMAGTGKPALFYMAVEVVKALVVCELRRAGFTPRQVRQVARNLEERGIRLDRSETYLLTDGYSVYFALSDDEVVDVLKHHRQMLLLVPIHEQVAKLQEVA
jgi:DNA-binding transcriptional MerR regulator